VPEKNSRKDTRKRCSLHSCAKR